MNVKFAILGCSLGLMLSNAAHAADSYLSFNIETALATAEFQEKLGDDIKFYFGKGKTPKIQEKFGEASTTQGANAFGRSDDEACQRAFLSAMIALKNRAIKEGANAVVNIRTRNNSLHESKGGEYECVVGKVVARVSLTGAFVKTAN